MKTLVRKNTNTKLGYELVVINENGEEKILEITELDPMNENSLKLPENPSNRKYISIKKIGNELELSHKESKTLGPRNNKTPRKSLVDYLEGDRKQLFLELIEEAKQNRENERNNSKTPTKEQLISQIEALKAQIAELSK